MGKGLYISGAREKNGFFSKSVRRKFWRIRIGVHILCNYSRYVSRMRDVRKFAVFPLRASGPPKKRSIHKFPSVRLRIYSCKLGAIVKQSVIAMLLFFSQTKTSVSTYYQLRGHLFARNCYILAYEVHRQWGKFLCESSWSKYGIKRHQQEVQRTSDSRFSCGNH